MADEREQRWTLMGIRSEWTLPAERMEVIDGPMMALGVGVEVVPASRLAEVEAERDDWQRRYDALLVDANAELAGAGHDLERAREALERIAAGAGGRFGRYTAAEIARSALAASSPTTRTEGR